MGEAGGGNSMTWFIEAWCPLDGHAFAAWREITAAGGSGAEEVYALYPPDFTPVTCTSEASALWATRGPYQHQFFRDDGSEYSFDSLDLLIELVRRVYVAGGVGPP